MISYKLHSELLLKQNLILAGWPALLKISAIFLKYPIFDGVFFYNFLGQNRLKTQNKLWVSLSYICKNRRRGTCHQSPPSSAYPVQDKVLKPRILAFDSMYESSFIIYSDVHVAKLWVPLIHV